VDAKATKQALHEWYQNSGSADAAAVARVVERNRALRSLAAAQVDDANGAAAAPDAAAASRIDAIREWGSRSIE
jgi:hypothetical protein